ncbi:PRC and DUF2382 domain-containing protein [Streptomyces lavendulae]|uniref:PRC and DUF2382 domain-containing protein n=1 Tax=Streptomyces lavendulae TaxID=1914 RepID=UPI0033D1C627
MNQFAGRNLEGMTLSDSSGSIVGIVQQVYVDDVSEEPHWVTVHAGHKDVAASFVPLHGARIEADKLWAAYTREQIKSAPVVALPGGHLDAVDEDALYRYYDITERRLPDLERARLDELVLSEERLTWSAEEHESGRAYLRKHIVVENVTGTVPLTHEEVTVTREPVTDRRVRADVSDAEIEVILHEEQAIAHKETVPVERVHVETRKITEQREVTGQVRKEELEELEYDNSRGFDGNQQRPPKH